VATFSDPTEARLAELLPEVARRAVLLVNAARDAGAPLYISSALRTPAEQQRLVAAGLSRTSTSLHLTGRAFDVDVVGFDRDALPKDWLESLGAFGESLGLRWGGRWKSIVDLGHFEF
jgi:peptidoglycan LD-endopeptidase CwlK